MNVQSIICILITFRSSKQMRVKHKIKANSVFILIAIYLLNTYSPDKCTINKVVRLVTYFGSDTVKKYVQELVNSGLVVYNNKVLTITQAGVTVLESIAENHNKLIFDICQSYNIEL